MYEAAHLDSDISNNDIPYILKEAWHRIAKDVDPDHSMFFLDKDDRANVSV